MLDIINAAGWPIWPLVFASIIAVAIILERLWALRSNIIAPDNLLLEVQKMITKDGVKKEAIQSLTNHSMLGEIFASALNNYNSSSDIIKEAIEETGRAVNHRLEKYLSLNIRYLRCWECEYLLNKAKISNIGSPRIG